MIAPDSKKFFFIINARAGPKKGTDWQKIIGDYFKPLNHSIKFYPLSGNTSVSELQTLITKWNPHRVIAVGGDGTVSLAAKALLGTSIELGILPAGSANGMAKELNLPLKAEDALAVAVSGKAMQTDVVEINESEICLHISDLGLNAQLIKNFESGKLRGKIGYAKEVVRLLFRMRRISVAVQLKNEEEVVRSALMVAIANASKYGTGAALNPDGNIYDGIFELIIIRKLSISEIIKMILRIRRFDPKKIEILHATSVTIETRKPTHFQVDGEYLGKIQKVKARILPSVLNLIVPEEKS